MKKKFTEIVEGIEFTEGDLVAYNYDGMRLLASVYYVDGDRLLGKDLVNLKNGNKEFGDSFDVDWNIKNAFLYRWRWLRKSRYWNF